MSFTPIVPIGGFAGWRFLQRTMDRQMETLGNGSMLQRDENHFRQAIGKVQTAKELVADYRLLSTALTAFGLSEDLPNRAFIQRVLETDLSDPRGFANRLADKRYAEIARAFDFRGETGNRMKDPAAVEALLSNARERRFEEAVGTQQGDLRLALALQRDLQKVAQEAGSDNAGWYTVLGTPSLREVFETAFGLPREFGALDLDRQMEILKTRTHRLTGRSQIAQFKETGPLEQLTRRFFVGAELSSIQQKPKSSVALSILQSIPRLQTH